MSEEMQTEAIMEPSVPTVSSVTSEIVAEEVLVPAEDTLPVATESADRLRILEAILFATDRPVPFNTLANCLREISKDEVRTAIQELQSAYENHRGVRLVEVAGGYQFRTAEDLAPWIRRLINVRPVRLSPAALEVLAIIAYRQPITRAGIEHIRGVDCGGVLKTLLERDLVRMIGRMEEPGRPTLYGTTKYFLEVFGLNTLQDLPTLKEFQELTPEESEQIQFIRPLDSADEVETAGDLMDAASPEE